MPLAKAMGDPQSLKKMVMGVGVLVVVFVIGYLVADNTVYEKASAGTSRMVGAGLITMYILAFLAIGGILFTEVQKMFK
jgi:cation transporter-like permease